MNATAERVWGNTGHSEKDDVTPTMLEVLYAIYYDVDLARSTYGLIGCRRRGAITSALHALMARGYITYSRKTTSGYKLGPEEGR